MSQLTSTNMYNMSIGHVGLIRGFLSDRVEDRIRRRPSDARDH